MLLGAGLTGCEFATAPEEGQGGVPPSCDTAAECAGAPNPLRTCNAKQDAYDCHVLALTKAAAEPDPMIFKAQISLESAFEVRAVSPDKPCGIKAGWTEDESKSFGLMQLTPACGWLPKARLPDGHPNLERDEASSLWATSVFNPTINVEDGVRAVQVGRAAVKKSFPGCTEVQYTEMALSAFNQGQSSVSGCGTLTPAGVNYVKIVLFRYQLLARESGYPYPY